MTQHEALNILKTGANVFLTGEPGSGKTYTVNRYVAWLHERGIAVAITASTGIAATHLGGFTIHSWSGVGIKTAMGPWELDRLAQNERVVRRVGAARVLIIDEVSMLSSDTLTVVEAACRSIRNSQLPFGGLQVILVGDFFQLPPVVKRPDPDAFLFDDDPERTESSRFAFASRAWEKLNPMPCYLTEQHRQEDAAFLELLSAMRRNTITAAHQALLVTRKNKSGVDGVTQLFSHNADVDAINMTELQKLDAGAITFTMDSRGPEPLVLGLKRGCLSPETLPLKIGARVMFTKNDPERTYVNGTLGTVTGFAKEGGYPMVKTAAGRTIVAEPAEWHIEDGGRILARINQIPLRLAWAMTVHKSQGMSLDAAHMDLSSAFEYGQGYVALSRVRTLAGLSLAGFNHRALQVHPEVHAKDQDFREQSDATREVFAKLPPDELLRLQKNFVRAAGGEWETVKEKKLLRTGKKGTTSITLALLQDKKDLPTIIKTRELKETTIISHIEDLIEAARITRLDIAHLTVGQEKIIAEIHEAMRTRGTKPLRPLYEEFHGRASYELLRLARLFFDA